MRSASKLCLITALYLSTTAANAAEFTPMPQHNAIVMRGEITKGDDKRFGKAWAKVKVTTGKDADVLVVDSPGGNVNAGMKLANAVKVADMYVGIPEHASCISMCLTVFAAGKGRLYDSTASIGVHAVSAFDEEDDMTLAITMKLARLWQSWGVPDNIVGLMTTTAPHNIRWLKTGEIDQGWAAVVE